MAVTFNSMVERIQNSHQELEERVGELTHQLSQLNEKLMEEITIRKQTGEQLQASLNEKDILLKEIHPRVKNHMQIISDLVNQLSGKLKIERDGGTEFRIVS